MGKIAWESDQVFMNWCNRNVLTTQSWYNGPFWSLNKIHFDSRRAWPSGMPLQEIWECQLSKFRELNIFCYKIFKTYRNLKRTINASPPTPNLKSRMLSIQLKSLVAVSLWCLLIPYRVMTDAAFEILEEMGILLCWQDGSLYGRGLFNL